MMMIMTMMMMTMNMIMMMVQPADHCVDNSDANDDVRVRFPFCCCCCFTSFVPISMMKCGWLLTYNKYRSGRVAIVVILSLCWRRQRRQWRWWWWWKWWWWWWCSCSCLISLVLLMKEDGWLFPYKECRTVRVAIAAVLLPICCVPEFLNVLTQSKQFHASSSCCNVDHKLLTPPHNTKKHKITAKKHNNNNQKHNNQPS